MYLVDTHQHLWNPRQIPCSWCAGIPALNRSFDLTDYRSASAATGIAKSVFVECDVDDPHQLAEAQLVQSLAEQHPLIAGMVASGRPENHGFPAYLEKLVTLTKLRGLRRVLHVVPDAVSRQSLFRENLRRLPAFNLTFDICALARQLSLARELVDACPNVTFILDHCGVPDVKGRAFDPWREEIRALAERPNLNCKISGLVAYADPANWTTADLRPWIEHVIECFGWDRIVWGGDWPVCTLSSTLGRWVAATHELTAAATKKERAKFFHLNAERIYRV
jgi:predicted TIM-barrel fold metal-dependent hydrolase